MLKLWVRLWSIFSCNVNSELTFNEQWMKKTSQDSTWISFDFFQKIFWAAKFRVRLICRHGYLRAFMVGDIVCFNAKFSELKLYAIYSRWCRNLNLDHWNTAVKRVKTRQLFLLNTIHSKILPFSLCLPTEYWALRCYVNLQNNHQPTFFFFFYYNQFKPLFLGNIPLRLELWSSCSWY